MSHGITDSDQFAQTGGQRAWHGLGSFIPSGLTAREALPRVGLGWETELFPAYADIGGQRVELDVRAHVRSDTQDVLGIVSKDYRPVQNLELAEFVDAIAGDDAAVTVETAGSLFGGRRVFCLARLPKTIEVAAGDEVVPYVLVTNGHGGFATFAVMPTSVRVVCANTLAMADSRNSRHGLRFVHTGKVSDKLAAARAALGLANKRLERFEEQLRELARTDLSVGQVRAFMEAAYDAAYRVSEDALADEEGRELLRAKREEVLQGWVRNLENERNSLPSIRGTAWAALNAVTEWHDHERGRAGDGTDARVHSNLFGVSAQAKRRTFELALAAGSA
jgi:phage/plasmid-like protein (TIGR03299 family)